MSTSTSTSLRITRTIAAPPERVFEAWTRPEHQRRWACPEGYSLEDVVTDLRVGGSFLLAMRSPEGVRHTAVGTYRVVEPPRKLVYTWDWEEDDQRVGETVVTVLFNEGPGGSTEVFLTHEGFPAEEAKVGHEEGWGSCLNKLQGMYA
jgi:uncharacterized protein YndB with AHSA1/START domain